MIKHTIIVNNMYNDIWISGLIRLRNINKIKNEKQYNWNERPNQ